MKKILLGLALTTLCVGPALAALKVGDTAPDFTLQAALGAKDYTYKLSDAVSKGPVVVYFYPSAYTSGCDLEAHTFADNAEKFEAVKAGIIGVSGDSIERLNVFEKDPAYCAGKFPVASDADLKVAGTYNLTTTAAKEGSKDVRGVEIGHGFIERTTFVVGKDRKILAVFSSKDDKITPDQHVEKSLELVTRLHASK